MHEMDNESHSKNRLIASSQSLVGLENHRQKLRDGT